ncbi:hypothetical protein AUEXF2481DRAFT_420873 [Aureobasidium subglaciale EXF-2481]|uniref:Uncharacterized protein n=1 Tax=Aureobasidium subglaciale (strain EXF-2481) TaxID=1043005 RepID=A0A074Y920_AURSE|nr:uncharacterized protein AUEXF2481DRAFT_420873 [Aureobasidium subglaciale EXF-2481]KEQ92489.1 hypothetical protein AUEXF2481DRAFT_420873 [Aureobasidium subglaciale EXF-2481]
MFAQKEGSANRSLKAKWPMLFTFAPIVCLFIPVKEQQVCYELKDTEIFVSSHPQLPKLSRCTMLSKAGQCSRKVRGRAALQFGSPRLEKALRISTAMFGTVAKDEIEEERT